MCGVVGAVSAAPGQPIGLEQIDAMRDAMFPRGPDDAGSVVEAGVALGSRRLAILDCSPRGHMPMESPDGRFVIVHNGEVYNYRDYRTELEARGHRFRSHSDTEVLLALYADRRERMLDGLNGMFAFAIWDRRERSLFVARDRLGVKPLYYAERDGTLLFASEQKVLFAGGVPCEFDPEVTEELLSFLYVAGARTPFRGVRRLPPGHYLLWKDGAAQVRCWWDLGARIRELRESGPPRDAVAWFRETFDDAVALRRISDVPVGLLLSGGLDSSSVAAALALQAGEGVESFTVRFTEQGYDEGPLARQVADRWRLTHHELVVAPDDLAARLRRACWLNDEPLAHDSDLHIGAIATHAKSRVTVLLSGEGADETLGGYVRYQPLRRPALLPLLRGVVPPATRLLGVGGRWRKLSRFLALGPVEQLVLYNSSNVLPADVVALGLRPTAGFEYRTRVVREARELFPGEPMRQAMFYDTRAFLSSLLDRNDRQTMGASIECRVPFLDYRLVEGLGALPSSVLLHGRRNKPLLRRAFADRLPADVLAGRKWGFAVPWHLHLRRVPELRDFTERLASSDVVLAGGLDQRAVRGVVDGFLKGDDAPAMLVKHLFMIAFWHEAYRDQLRTRAGVAPKAGARAPSAA